ncbi:uncharacterized protein PV09_07056 [Verruconis gallopava]|uniref:Uncharacterized protein n=1 Tax=Verruconis gallopava TaxID=253628 RepID=A0A0D2A467_9PEZI|nr:uncharacterized protein PV09_07056 [Verruconis gallopava]KIW01583.1 hypothetical protein PV09_07056 [Verruconis gallopava]
MRKIVAVLHSNPFAMALRSAPLARLVMNPLLLPFLAIPSYLCYKLLFFVLRNARNARKARQLGCKPAPTFPSPDPLGIIPVANLFKANSTGYLPQHVLERFDTVSRQEGRPVHTFVAQLLRLPLYVTRDPKNIQAILATQFKDFELGPIRHGTFSPLLGAGIFSADGRQWEHSRALLRPQFARNQVSDLELEEVHMQHMFKAMPVGSDGWTDVIDLIPLFFRLTVDSATEFLFGESVGTQLAALPGADQTEWQKHAAFVTAFEQSQDCIARAFRLNDFYSLYLTKQYRDYCKTVHEYIDRFVQKALAHDSEKKLESGEKEKYIFLEQLAQATKDPIEIRDQLLSILVAGRDTTAGLLSFLFRVLSKEPAKFNKLRDTILNDFGTDESKLSFSSLKSCQYLQWCLNETLRLYPSVPLNSRRSVVDTTLPRGGGPDGMSPLFVPKGTEVNYSVFATMRTPEFWGPDADEFKPERWENKKPGFEYLPFNGGPRICLGQQFALTEAGYVTVRMLQKFDKLDGSAHGDEPIPWFLTLTGRPMDGVKLRLHAAAE